MLLRVEYAGGINGNTGYGQVIAYGWASAAPTPSPHFIRTLGLKRYELTNHLGNVLAVITDKKTITGSGPYSFDAEVISEQDYYAFGAPLPARNYQQTLSFYVSTYRYGFNGKEKDDEVKGAGDSYDYGARMYDSRLGRWLSVDPMSNKYPDQSPYNSFADNPAVFLDPDGKDIIRTTAFDHSRYSALLDIMIKQNNPIVMNYVTYFMGDDKTLKLDYGLLYNKAWKHSVNFGWSGSTQGSEGSRNVGIKFQSWVEYDIPYNFGSSEYNTGIVNYDHVSDISMVTTIMHELIHAKRHLETHTHSNGQQHESMTDKNEITMNRQEIVDALQSFNDANSLGLNKSEIQTLSWVGLEGTAAWNKIYDTEDKINAYNSEVKRLTYYQVQRDSKGNYLNNNGQSSQKNIDADQGNTIAPTNKEKVEPPKN